MFYLDNLKKWLESNTYNSLDYSNLEHIYLYKKNKTISLVITTLNEESNIKQEDFNIKQEDSNSGKYFNKEEKINDEQINKLKDIILEKNNRIELLENKIRELYKYLTNN